MKKIRLSLIVNLCFFISIFHSSVSAVETAPRISDREIIESLAEIKTTQKAILQRFEQVDKRFEQVDKRFDELRADMLTRFEQVDKRFEQMDKRLDDTNAANRLFFGFILTLLLTLFGYIIWDRRTLMKPLEEKIIQVDRELDIGAGEGSKIKRLIEALKELSKEDEKVANALRQFHLL